MAWTKAEDKYLIEHYDLVPTRKIAERLNKTTFTISARKRRLGLHPKNISKKQTICINCDNARADRCSWVRYGNPKKGVEGWRVTKTIIDDYRKPIHTVRVDCCPKFVRAKNAG